MIFNSNLFLIIFIIIYNNINIITIFNNRVILEDRRIRLIYWISKIIHKPVDRFKNPKCVD